MKKTLLLVGSLLIAMGASAQITITNADIFPPVSPDTAKGNLSTNASITVPTKGNNQTWDYQFLTNNGTRNFTLNQPGNNPDFPNAIGKLETQLFIGPVEIEGTEEYYGNDANGFYFEGLQTQTAKYDISVLTGSSGDTLKIIGTFLNLGTQVKRYALPLTQTSQWTNQYVTTIDFEVTVATVGLYNEPGQLKRYYVENYEVVGWGDVMLPGGLGTHEALLVQSNVHIVDSLYLGGAPANPLLLAGLGISQGAITQFAFDDLYIRGLNRSAIQFETDSSHTNVYQTTYCSEPSQFSVVENVKISTKLFPNPAQNGVTQLVFFKPTSQTWSLLVVDVLGKTVHSETIERSGEINAIIELPKTKGTYFYALKNGKGQTVDAGKIVQ